MAYNVSTTRVEQTVIFFDEGGLIPSKKWETE